MKLNLIYGNSGSGKSYYIYQDIKKNINEKNIYLIVPEQSNLSAEVKLLNILNKDTIINVEVLTLKRMAYRIINQIKGDYNRLNDVGKNLIIYNSLVNRKKDLKFLNKNEKNIDTVSRTITEFKKHNILIENLENIEIDDEYTRLKLEDIKIIYKDYQNKINNQYLDENDDLSLLSQCLDKTDIFKDSLIYFDEFSGFTPQEFNVFKKLLLNSKQTTISICTDNLDIKNKENDIFYFNKLFANKILDFASKNKIEVSKKQIDENKKFKTNELKIIEENFSGKSKKVYENETKNIELFLADNPYSELEYVAKRIIMYARQGYRYNKIAVLTSNLEDYLINAKMIFENYDIPLYLDYKKQLSENILVKYILSILEIFSTNWSIESIINYLKIGLLNLDENIIFEFENYCKKWGIRNKKIFEKFEYEPANQLQEILENTRYEIINPLKVLKENISNNRNVKHITTSIYEFLIDNSIINNLNEKIKEINNIEITNEYSTSYRLLIELLDEIIRLFGEEKISFDKYKELLRVGLNSQELGTIPATKDQVILGEINRAKFDDIDICFIIGANDGSFPMKLDSEGYFNDKDREILKLSGIELAKDSIDTLYEDEFNVYKTVTIPNEKLIITYSSSNLLGGTIRPSTIIKKVKRIFPKIIEKSNIINKQYTITNKKSTIEDALEKYVEYLNGKEIDEEWKKIIKYYQITDEEEFKNRISALYFNNIPEKLSEKNIENLYKNELKASISKLEEYRKCPFSYHIKYGLNLKEAKEFKIQTLDTGNFMHEVIDNFFSYIEEEDINLHNIEEIQIKSIIEDIIDNILELSKYYVFTSTPKFKSLTRKLKKVVLEAVIYIVYTIKNSRFDVLGHEVEFGKNKKYPAIIIDNEDGTKTELSGKIDRIDIGKIGEKEILRVIDYKSSIKNIDLNKVINGLQIQLLTYIDSIVKQTNTFPGRSFIYESNREYCKV
ncbi:MAG: PD-(D/E)XK nuclease family protein [Candidatus Scatovivens sp.]